MESVNSEMLEMWREIKAQVDALEFDVQKSIRGTASAGVRVRKGLRRVKNSITGLVKMVLNGDKALKAERTAIRAAKKAAKENGTVEPTAQETITPAVTATVS